MNKLISLPSFVLTLSRRRRPTPGSSVSALSAAHRVVVGVLAFTVSFGLARAAGAGPITIAAIQFADGRGVHGAWTTPRESWTACLGRGHLRPSVRDLYLRRLWGLLRNVRLWRGHRLEPGPRRRDHRRDRRDLFESRVPGRRIHGVQLRHSFVLQSEQSPARSRRFGHLPPGPIDGAPALFAGWEDAGGISRIRFEDLSNDISARRHRPRDV